MKFALFAACLLIFCSCGSPSATESPEVSSAIASDEVQPEPEKEEPVVVELNFSKEPAKTVLAFLKWYRKNYNTVNRIELVDQKITRAHPAYTVNTKGTDAYLALLGKSGYLSNIYLNGWRNYFRERDAWHYSNKQTEGPPRGFEYDFVLWTQEIDDALEAIAKAQVIEIQQLAADRMKVSVDIYMRLRFTLSETDGKWLIDDIENRGTE